MRMMNLSYAFLGTSNRGIDILAFRVSIIAVDCSRAAESGDKRVIDHG
jgi:hypothetical protein